MSDTTIDSFREQVMANFDLPETCSQGKQAGFNCHFCHLPVCRGDEDCSCSTLREDVLQLSSLCPECAETLDTLLADTRLGNIHAQLVGDANMAGRPSSDDKQQSTFSNQLKLEGTKVEIADIDSPKAFSAFTDEWWASETHPKPQAFAIGVGLKIGDQLVAAQYPVANFGDNYGTAAIFSSVVGRAGKGAPHTYELSRDHQFAIADAFSVYNDDDQPHPNIEAFKVIKAAAFLYDDDSEHEHYNKAVARPTPIVTFIDNLQAGILGPADAYLRLHLLSQCKVLPNSINLDGLFGAVETLAWTSFGVFRPADMPLVQAEVLMQDGMPVHVYCLDKFPPMLTMCVPEGVRIADGQRARLGAHLAPGTTVMHEGFCNHNAGTLGESMVEGRISQGVVVGNGSDIGGGASTMGTLSGGGKEKISIGERCLVGANAGIGIVLGDNCVVEAGLYLTGGTRVKMPDGNFIRASDLSGICSALFRRNSQTGEVELLPHKGEPTWGGLNADLHAN